MERDVTPITPIRARDDPGPPRPEPLDQLAVLEAMLNPAMTQIERATLLARVRAEQERLEHNRPRNDR